MGESDSGWGFPMGMRTILGQGPRLAKLYGGNCPWEPPKLGGNTMVESNEEKTNFQTAWLCALLVSVGFILPILAPLA